MPSAYDVNRNPDRYREPVNQQRLIPGQTTQLRAPGSRTPYEDAQAAKSAATRNMFLKRIALPAAAFATGGAALAGGVPSFGIGAANTGTWATAAPAAKGAVTFGNLLKLGELGIGAGTSLYAQRSQNKALDRQSQIEQANYAQQLQMAQEAEAYRRAEADRYASEDRRRWEAEEAYRAKQVAADEEERAFNRRLIEEREARRAPRRAASQQALLRLQDLLRLGRG